MFLATFTETEFFLKQMQDDLNEIYACTMNEYFSSLRFSFFFAFSQVSLIIFYVIWFFATDALLYSTTLEL